MNRIRQIRKQLGYNQVDLANKLGYSQTLISKWEIGSRDPDTQALIQLSKLFNVSIDELLGIEREVPIKNMSSELVIPDEKKETVQQLLALPEKMFIFISGEINAYYQASQIN